MEAIKLNGRIDQDGVLKLEIPVNMPDTEVEVMVIVQPRKKREWPEGYFESTAGSLADMPIERPPQVSISQLTAEISQIMQEENVTLDDLLAGLEEAGEEVFREMYGDTSTSNS